MTGASSSIDSYDVTICGGGLAGLTLARQLNLRMPELKVLVIDKQARPLPVACHKVGESSIEGGSTYFSKVLALDAYLKKSQLPKLGLRFFWGSGELPLDRRCEYGLSHFPPMPTVQLDRGTFEADLRAFAEQTGSTLWEGFSVDDIKLSESDAPHRVTCSNEGGRRTVETRWVIDAMGRRQFLKRRLDLTHEFGRKHSSSWWRYKGRIDISKLVPESNTGWHARVPGNMRYYSTNHLLGDHYWFWLIPLASGFTSAGIVAGEDQHPFETFNTFERAMSWLKKHEPRCHELLAGLEPEDFRVMRRYTYSARQVFSRHRWALVGEAGVFSDPYFSTGSDLIGAANCLISELIRLDLREKSLDPKVVEATDQTFLQYSRFITDNIQRLYDYSGNAVVGAARYLWGNVIGPPITLPVIIGFLHKEGCLSDQTMLSALSRYQVALSGISKIGRVMLGLFDQWLAKSPNRGRFEMLDYLQFSLVGEMFERVVKPNVSADELVAGADVIASIAERLAQAVFLIAVEDVYPDLMSRFRDPVWLNVEALSLDPERWEADGLFAPKSPFVDITALRKELRALFQLAGDSTPPPPPLRVRTETEQERASYLSATREVWRCVQ